MQPTSRRTRATSPKKLIEDVKPKAVASAQGTKTTVTPVRVRRTRPAPAPLNAYMVDPKYLPADGRPANNVLKPTLAPSSWVRMPGYLMQSLGVIGAAVGAFLLGARDSVVHASQQLSHGAGHAGAAVMAGSLAVGNGVTHVLHHSGGRGLKIHQSFGSAVAEFGRRYGMFVSIAAILLVMLVLMGRFGYSNSATGSEITSQQAGTSETSSTGGSSAAGGSASGTTGSNGASGSGASTDGAAPDGTGSDSTTTGSTGSAGSPTGSSSGTTHGKGGGTGSSAPSTPITVTTPVDPVGSLPGGIPGVTTPVTVTVPGTGVGLNGKPVIGTPGTSLTLN